MASLFPTATLLQNAKHSVELALIDLNLAKQADNGSLHHLKTLRIYYEDIEMLSPDERYTLNEQLHRLDVQRRNIRTLDRTLKARVVMVRRLERQIGNGG